MSLAVSLETLLMKSCIFIYLFLNLLCQNDAAPVPICLTSCWMLTADLLKKNSLGSYQKAEDVLGREFRQVER